MRRIQQHVLDMLQLGLAVGVGIEQPPVYRPELVRMRVNVEASDDTDPFDDVMCVAAILAAHRLDRA